jgi:two-component system OmpR family sensor kinase
VSLRARLLIAIGVIAVVGLVVADVVTYRALGSFLYQQVDQNLDRTQDGFARILVQGDSIVPFCKAPGSQHFGFPGGALSGSGPATGDGDGEHGGGNGPGQPSNAEGISAVEVTTTTGTIVQSCPAYVDSKAYLPSLPGTVTGFSPAADGTQVAYLTAPSTKAGGPTFRVQVSKVGNGQELVIAQPVADVTGTLHHLLLVELVVTGVAVVLALLAGVWLVGLGLKPLRDMEDAAEAIAAGNLTERVPGENATTEVGRLAGTLNLMLARIESAFADRVASEEALRSSEARLRRFVADASHELRTPIAAVSAYAELFGRGASDQKEDLERLMGGIRSETTRMERLVADLLQLARLDEGRPLEQRSVDLVALCAEAARTATTVGPEWPVEFDATHPIEVIGDASSLRQVLDNLLGNVRSHTPAGTRTHVSLDGDGTTAVLRIADDGPGMDAEQAAHIFERFYRADPSRSRLAGGAGLGLSIVSAIVTAHGGTVAATGAPGSGMVFEVRLPVGGLAATSGAPDTQEAHSPLPPASNAVAPE